ncbi:MAG: hypothetical protein JW913_13070 [Chitinispirillaceae bacterium]|nr:hypothetical protein [Chitinispirillaceae bacterium]
MIKHRLILGTVAVTVAVLFLRCVKGPVAGGSSDTEVSARISGIAVDSDSNPVAGAHVQLRPKDYLPSSRLQKPAVLRTMIDGVTDENGSYIFDSISDGSYILEVTGGDTDGAIAECIMSGAASCTVSTTLKPFGTVIGAIDLSYENNLIRSRAKVEVFGTEHIVHPDSDGWFQLSLPAGRHRLKFSVDSSYFDSLMIYVEVSPSQDQFIGIRRLNYLPYPPCWDYTCDSSALRALLDSAGHPDIPVQQVATCGFRGRIVAINLRNIPIAIPLAPLGALNGVEKLDLGSTGTADSCRFICGLWNLETLLLDSNNLSGLSHAFESAFQIQELNLSNNQLETLPERIYKISPMRGLDLSGNRLCAMSTFITGWADKYDPGWREEQACY